MRFLKSLQVDFWRKDVTSYFVNLKKANAENARLSEELKRVSGELAAAQAAIAEHNASAEAVTAKADAAITDLAGKLAAAEARVKELEANAKTAGQIAAEVAAAQGIPADKLPKASDKPAAATMPRAQFSKLSAFDQMHFCQTGGKITD